MKNRYHPIRRLDATQYGHIDLVEDQLVGNKCVLKAVYKSAGEIRIHQWKMELRALTEIQSSHIPAVVDVIEDKDCYSLVESYIDGVPLDEWVAKHRFRKVRFRKRFFLELMQAVDDVHRTGFLYIDLKPANCLIMNQHLYLIDFNACMEIGGTSVILASRENYSKTMRSADQKGVELDILGLLKMFRFLYPYHIHFFIVFHVFKHAITKEISRMRRWYIWMLLGQRVLSFLILINLSVFCLAHSFSEVCSPMELYRKDPTPQTFRDAYRYSQTHWDHYQSLYEWVNNGWIDESLWKDEEIAEILLKEAVQLKDPDIIRTVLKKSGKRLTQTDPFLILEANVQIHESVDLKQVNDCLKQLEHKQDGRQLSKMIQLLFQSDTWINETQGKRLSHLVKKCSDSFSKQQAIQITEYSLVLLSKGNSSLKIPDRLINRFEKEDDFHQIISLWKEGQ